MCFWNTQLSEAQERIEITKVGIDAPVLELRLRETEGPVVRLWPET
jgi:hypothetical protein